jgi:hypothetical protein
MILAFSLLTITIPLTVAQATSMLSSEPGQPLGNLDSCNTTSCLAQDLASGAGSANPCLNPEYAKLCKFTENKLGVDLTPDLNRTLLQNSNTTVNATKQGEELNKRFSESLGLDNNSLSEIEKFADSLGAMSDQYIEDSKDLHNQEDVNRFLGIN